MNYVLKASLGTLVAIIGGWLVFYGNDLGLFFIVLGASANFIFTSEGERSEKLNNVEGGCKK